MIIKAKSAGYAPVNSSGEQAIADRMLDTLEVMHYSSYYADELFIICFLEEASVSSMLYDLHTLQMSGIRSMVLLSNNRNAHRQDMEDIKLLYPKAPFIDIKPGDILPDNLTEVHKSNHLIICRSDTNNVQLRETAFSLASVYNCRKLIIITGEETPFITIDGNTVSHIKPYELLKKLETTVNTVPARDELCRMCEVITDRLRCDVVMMNSSAGGLFSEIFTYRGFGSLISKFHNNYIRKAEANDVVDILMIMRPDIESGLVLPMSAKQIRDNIDSFYVYTVDNSIVALCRLVDYGNAYEFAKFCTLPRYRGQRRAQELVNKLLEDAAHAGKEYAFSLTVSDKMTEFFKTLKFTEVSREELPENWKKHYDFSRPSKAFKYLIKDNAENSPLT